MTLSYLFSICNDSLHKLIILILRRKPVRQAKANLFQEIGFPLVSTIAATIFFYENSFNEYPSHFSYFTKKTIIH